jgi:glutathione S-transferase
MILIGQYDSPFVRRVGVALRLYNKQFEHRPWSTFGDADKIRVYSPMTRVPVLVLDNGDVLIESHLILDYLDSQVSDPLYPREEPARHRALKIAALATNLSDKAVSLFYELNFHDTVSDLYVARCRTQIMGALSALELSRAATTSTFWFGDKISHTDIAVACSLRHFTDAYSDMVDIAEYPALNSHAAQHEAMPVFQEIQQVFIPPSK